MQGRKQKTTTEHVTSAMKYATPSAGTAGLVTVVLMGRLDHLFQTDYERTLASVVIMGLVGIITNVVMVIWKKKLSKYFG